MPWLLASAYLIAAAAANQHAAADNYYPSLESQRTFLPPSRTIARAPVDKIGALRGNAPPTHPTVMYGNHAAYYTAVDRLNTFLAIIWSMTFLGMVIYMFHGPNTGGTAVHGPSWDPAGHGPFREWIREVQAWLNATSTRLTPTAQAAALQLGLRGTARTYALTIPAAAITFGAEINGVPTDPVTYLLYVLGNRFEQLEDERTMVLGNQVLDFGADQARGLMPYSPGSIWPDMMQRALEQECATTIL